MSGDKPCPEAPVVKFCGCAILLKLIILLLSSITGVIFLGGVSVIALLQSNALVEVAKRYRGEEIRKEIKREGDERKSF